MPLRQRAPHSYGELKGLFGSSKFFSKEMSWRMSIEEQQVSQKCKKDSFSVKSRP